LFHGRRVAFDALMAAVAVFVPVQTRLLTGCGHRPCVSSYAMLCSTRVGLLVRSKPVCSASRQLSGCTVQMPFSAKRRPTRAMNEKQVTAIVPAYNESFHVEAVVRTLLRSPSVGEIIVVDDGSSDDTSVRITSIDGVTLLRNERNLGKAASLERGVRAASFDTLFFCDADLVGFKPEHVEAIVRPVIDGEYDMFIGVRRNIMQTAVHAFALNSGERALRKEIWFGLPDFFKHRYRVEAGLNFFVKHQTEKGLGWKEFDYTHVIKESKYGILIGTILRWWMNFDVASACLSYPVILWRLRHKSRKALISRD
jgi:glycosyltransferase involved in cell wall biosynthesis